jgi:hypothetical protein
MYIDPSLDLHTLADFALFYIFSLSMPVRDRPEPNFLGKEYDPKSNFRDGIGAFELSC